MRKTLARRVDVPSLLRYLLVGGLCFLADVVLLWLLHEILGLPLAVAAPAGFLLSFALTYTAQRLAAFRSSAAVPASVAKYATLVIFNTVATAAIVSGVDALGWGWLIGKVVAVAVTTVWNYFVYRYWVFATPDESGADV